MDRLTEAAFAVADAAVAQEKRHEDLRRAMETPGQSEVADGGYKVATGPWAQHASVQLSRASGELHRAVKAYEEAKALTSEAKLAGGRGPRADLVVLDDMHDGNPESPVWGAEEDVGGR